MHLFKMLANDAFLKSTNSSSDFIKRIQRAVRSWLLDSYYDSQVLKAALKCYFNSTQMIFEYFHEQTLTYVEIMTISVIDFKSVLLINYNGMKKLKENCDLIF